MLNSPDLTEIAMSTCRVVVEFFKVDHSAIVFFDPDLERGHVVAEFPLEGKTVGMTVPVRGGPGKETLIASKRPIVFQNDTTESASLEPVQDIFARLGIRSNLIVPIIIDDRIVGSFSLDSIRQPRAFGDNELEQCRVLAVQVAAAVKAARRVDLLESIRQTALTITSQALDRKELLFAIIRDAVALLEAEHGGIYEYHPERGELTAIIDYGRSETQSILNQSLKVGEGMAGRLVQGNMPFLIVDDYANWPGQATSYSSQKPFGAVVEVPLKWQGHILGVLYVDDEVGRKFTQEDAAKLQLLADPAAIALINAANATKITQLGLIAQASRKIMAALTLGERLELIASSVATILNAEACGIFSQPNEQYLILEASYGHRLGGYEKGKKLTIQCGPKSGLTGCIAHEGLPFTAYGEELTNHFAVKGELPHTHSGKCYSLIMLPLLKRELNEIRIIGWIRADNKKDQAGQIHPNIYFMPEDQSILELFAEAAVMAIETGHLYDQLESQSRAYREETQRWLKWVSSAWGHEVGKHAITIQNEVQALRNAIGEGQSRIVTSKLEKIEDLAKQIKAQPMTLPVSNEEGVESVLLNALLSERLKQLWEREMFKSVKRQTYFELPESAKVRLSPDWFRRVVDIVVENAVEAMKKSPVKQITITTMKENNQAKIVFADTGPGISPEVWPHLFKTQIPEDQRTKGTGISLLIARNIIDTYGGEIEIGSPETGAEIVIRLPLEQSRTQR